MPDTAFNTYMLRHALQQAGNSNPNLDPAGYSKIEVSAKIIADELVRDGITNLVFVASPANRAVETAIRLMATETLKPYCNQSTPIQLPTLDIDTWFRYSDEDRDWRWNVVTAQLDQLIGNDKTRLVLVTHEPIIRDIYTEAPHIDTFHVGINRVTIKYDM